MVSLLCHAQLLSISRPALTEGCEEVGDDLGVSRAVPGAVEFVRFAVDHGVKPVFITSRQNITRAGTARNLAALGLRPAGGIANEIDGGG